MLEKQLTPTDLARIATEKQLSELKLWAIASRIVIGNTGTEYLITQKENKK